MDKRERRRDCFARIRQLSEEAKDAYSATICAYLSALPELREASTVMSYLALGGEPNLSMLVEENPKKRWAFSRVNNDGLISFHHVTGQEQLTKGDFGFLEPHPETCPQLSPVEGDIILIPGVSFDTDNHARLGRGKGHYDRFLAEALQARKRPLLVGVCFSTQLSSLEPEAHDIPMDRILTENGFTTPA